MIYGRLTLVTRDIGRTADNHVLSLWRCECGRDAAIAFSRVKAGTTRSCGCLIAEAGRANAKHGGRKSAEYSSWIAMRRRCLAPKDKDFHRYGARGVTICPEWSDFAVFLADVGPRPAGTTLDRIDTLGNYEPGNVRWATATVQARNRRGTSVWHVKGQTFASIADAAAAFEVSEQTVYRWAHGAFDARRGTRTRPRADCTAERRYS